MNWGEGRTAEGCVEVEEEGCTRDSEEEVRRTAQGREDLRICWCERCNRVGIGYGYMPGEKVDERRNIRGLRG